MVYVLNYNGEPLMPTERHGKVKRLLKSGQAKVVRRTPFTIQLLYESGQEVQEIILGVDAGSKIIGLSASTESKELYASETQLRNDIVGFLSERKMYRRARRTRKTRYRAPRFLNRVRSKKPGWIAPSVQHKVNSHLRLVREVHKILPISKIIVEVAAFDIQKIKNPNIQGVEYQQGDQLDFWNVREYVFFRDGHQCHGRKGCQNKILNVHHIESRQTGGNAPNNLITLCETCHRLYHQGKITLKAKRGISFRDATFMGIMRWTFYNQLKVLYPNISLTFGYITKNTRIKSGLEKTHAVDALCISGHPMVVRTDNYYQQKFVRRNNRCLHKATILKGGIRKSNQAARFVFGYQLFDKVLYRGQECFIFGRRSNGGFDIRLLDGTKLSANVSYKKLIPLEKRHTLLIQGGATSSAA